MDKPDFSNSCYKTKDDKRHSTIFWRGDLSQETAEEREQRIENLRKNRGRWVWDEETRELVRAEEYYAKKQDINAPQVSQWNPEWAVLATGKRMSKGELKQYCRTHGKEWIG